MQCRYLSQRSTSDIFSGTVLRQRDFPQYFRALDEQRAVVANDALTDPRTSELRSTYQIQCKFETDLPVSRVFMDPSQLERALLNLVLNARDAMPAGGELTIRVEDVVVAAKDEEDDPHTYVSIAVCDTGSGMNEDTLGKILRPFFTTKGENGTGLGLAIVDQIVARAGGFVRFHSKVDQGTTAIIHLPRIASATGR